jgi:hypothetical protein
MHHALDNVIVTLCELSSILASADTPTVTFEVRFSRDKKAQMAAKVSPELSFYSLVILIFTYFRIYLGYWGGWLSWFLCLFFNMIIPGPV